MNINLEVGDSLVFYLNIVCPVFYFDFNKNRIDTIFSFEDYREAIILNIDNNITCLKFTDFVICCYYMDTRIIRSLIREEKFELKKEQVAMPVNLEVGDSLVFYPNMKKNTYPYWYYDLNNNRVNSYFKFEDYKECVILTIDDKCATVKFTNVAPVYYMDARIIRSLIREGNLELKKANMFDNPQVGKYAKLATDKPIKIQVLDGDKVVEEKQINLVMNFDNKKFLQWIYDRMINIHNEPKNVDYMLKFKDIIDNITLKENFSEKPMMDALPDYGDLFTVDHFQNAVNTNVFTDDDGIGMLATDNGNSWIKISPSEFSKEKLPKWATHILWFNK